MSLHEHTIGQAGAAHAARTGTPAAPERQPVVIEAIGIEKCFRVPDQRVDSFKERFSHPLRKIHTRELRALRNVSFEIRRGEFFGIVGRNGSGKSSLLKILGSIYKADGGRVRVAGRIAPFIELGVGFNPELTARENVVLGGVLMGLTRREAARRLDSVIDFSELHDFVDLRIKNYSSGMMVRLAFAIMVQADADIMLIDEVLAVGDAAFAQKCMDVFHQKRDAGKTIVLVTHDMATVQLMCHRAMLLHDGELRYVGSPEDTALRYYRLNFADQEGPQPRDGDRTLVRDVNLRVVSAGLVGRGGSLVSTIEQGAPINIDILFETARDLRGPVIQCHLLSEAGVVVSSFTRVLDKPAKTGERIRMRGTIENRLVPGRYFLDCWIQQDEHENVFSIQATRVLSFVVFGTAAPYGVVRLDTDIEATLER